MSDHRIGTCLGEIRVAMAGLGSATFMAAQFVRVIEANKDDLASWHGIQVEEAAQHLERVAADLRATTARKPVLMQAAE